MLKNRLNQFSKLDNYKFIILICFFIYTFVAFTLPMEQCPDEYARYSVTKFIVDYKKLPIGGDPLIRNKIWGFDYAFLPILSNICSAILIMISKNLFLILPDHLFRFGRLASVVFSLVSINFIIKISKMLFEEKYRLPFILSICLWPQFIFLSSYMNNDILAFMSVTIIIYYFIRCMKYNYLKDILGLSVGYSVCLLSYYNAFPFILFSGIAILIKCICYRNKESTELSNNDGYKICGLNNIYILCLTVFILAGWWYIRNIFIYQGDILGLKTLNKCSEMFAIDSLKPSMRQTPNYLNWTLKYMLFDRGWIKITIKSLFCTFGYMSFRISNIYYNLIGIFVLLGLVSFFINIKKQRNVILNIFFLLSSILVIFLSIIYSYFTDFQPQGRYIITILLPLLYFVTRGFEFIDKIILKYINKNIGMRYIMPFFIVFVSFYSFVNYYIYLINI